MLSTRFDLSRLKDAAQLLSQVWTSKRTIPVTDSYKKEIGSDLDFQALTPREEYLQFTELLGRMELHHFARDDVQAKKVGLSAEPDGLICPHLIADSFTDFLQLLGAGHFPGWDFFGRDDLDDTAHPLSGLSDGADLGHPNGVPDGNTVTHKELVDATSLLGLRSPADRPRPEGIGCHKTQGKDRYEGSKDGPTCPEPLFTISVPPSHAKNSSAGNRRIFRVATPCFTSCIIVALLPSVNF